jgi:hypothetical protein
MSGYPLDEFWPRTTVPVEQWRWDKELTSSIRIGSFNEELNGFTVLCAPHFDLDIPPLEMLTIPRQYKNGLRLLNSKISYLQECMMLLSDTNRNTPKGGQENLDLAKDSVMRNLLFNTRIRKEFLNDVTASFGKSMERLPDNYESLTMNAWLNCEFRCGRHDPLHIRQAGSDIDWKSNDILKGRLYSYLMIISPYGNSR